VLAAAGYKEFKIDVPVLDFFRAHSCILALVQSSGSGKGLMHGRFEWPCTSG
jgi:hypothetical protein